jgi:tRNA A-37 threonylcarbamoyl transferase component Bud32
MAERNSYAYWSSFFCVSKMFSRAMLEVSFVLFVALSIFSKSQSWQKKFSVGLSRTISTFPLIWVAIAEHAEAVSAPACAAPIWRVVVMPSRLLRTLCLFIGICLAYAIALRKYMIEFPPQLVSNRYTRPPMVRITLCTVIVRLAAVSVAASQRESTIAPMFICSAPLSDSASLAFIAALMFVLWMTRYMTLEKSSKRLESLEATLHEERRRALENAHLIPASEIAVLDRLGSGAFGVVYRARWKDRDVAIKQLNLSKSSAGSITRTIDAKLIQRQLVHYHETAILRKINGGVNVVEFLGVTELGSEFAIVMEFMSLGSLAGLLVPGTNAKYKAPAKASSLRWGLWYILMQDIARGLESLHGMGIIHMDLKPENILLEPDRPLRAKLADFGVSGDMSVTGTLFEQPGTIAWFPPEAFSKEPRTPQSDMYTFGSLVWSLGAYRSHPFEGCVTSVKQLRDRVLSGQTEAIPSAVPRKIRRVIERCWSLERSARPSATEVVREMAWDEGVARTKAYFGLYG